MSGVLSPGHGIDLTVGHATLTRDALGQPLAQLTLWLPEGVGSDGWEWAPVMYILGNLIDTAAEVLFDYRADTGEISREGSFPLPSWEQDDTLHAPADYPDDEVFTALVDIIRPDWQIEPVEEATLDLLRAETPPHQPFDEEFEHMLRWKR